jgi:alpha-glucoside transport system substrate-binding protein
MTRNRWHLLALILALVLSIGVTACGGDGDDEGAATTAEETEGEAAEPVSGSITFTGVWTGDEQKFFQDVIKAFQEENPDATVKYTPGGDNIVTVLSTAVEGGNPPEMASLAQPGVVGDFADRGALQPLDFVEDAIRENFGQSILDVGSFDGQPYGLLFKAANKSTVWYNVAAFEEAGVEPPETWEDMLEAAETLKASGTPAWSIG